VDAVEVANVALLGAPLRHPHTARALHHNIEVETCWLPLVDASCHASVHD